MRIVVVLTTLVLPVVAWTQDAGVLPKYLVPNLDSMSRTEYGPGGSDTAETITARPGVSLIAIKGPQVGPDSANGIVILSDGTIHYEYSDRYFDRVGLKTGTIPESEFRRLADFIASSNWLSLERGYAGLSPAGPETLICVVMNGQAKLVVVSPNRGLRIRENPELIIEFGRRIDQAVLNANWETPETTREIVSEIVKGLHYPAPFVRWASAIALGRLGVQAHYAVDELANSLSDPDDGVQLEALRALGAIGWRVNDHVEAITPFLSHKSPSFRDSAAIAIAASGTRDPSLLPQLIEMMSDPDIRVRSNVADALSNFGAEARAAVPLLMTELANWPPESMKFATHEIAEIMRAIAKIAPDTPGYVDAMVQLAKRSPSDFMWSEVLRVLSELPGHESTIVDEVIPLLQRSRFAGVQKDAVDYLGALGSQASKAIPALSEFISGDANYGTPFAIEAIQKILGHSDEAAQVIAEFVSHPDASVRMYALISLGKIGSQNPSVAPILIEGLSSDLLDVRRFSARALGMAGRPEIGSDPDAPSETRGQVEEITTRTIQELKTSIRSPDVWVRSEAALALARLEPEGPEVRKVLLELVSEGESHIPGLAALSLSLLRPVATEAIPSLVSLLDSEYGDIQMNAARAILQMNPFAAETEPALIELLSLANLREHLYKVDQLSTALSERRIAPTLIVPALVTRLDSDFSQTWIFEHLTNYGEFAAESLPLLEELVQYAETKTREAAAKAVEEIQNAVAAAQQR